MVFEKKWDDEIEKIKKKKLFSGENEIKFSSNDVCEVSNESDEFKSFVVENFFSWGDDLAFLNGRKRFEGVFNGFKIAFLNELVGVVTRIFFFFFFSDESIKKKKRK